MRLLKRSRTLNLSRNDLLSVKKNSEVPPVEDADDIIMGMKYFIFYLENKKPSKKSLNCIPERYDQTDDISGTSKSEFWTSQETHMKIEDQRDLIQKLLKREHKVFQKNSNQKRLPMYKLFDQSKKNFPHLQKCKIRSRMFLPKFQISKS
jgi:hypothetical protein